MTERSAAAYIEDTMEPLLQSHLTAQGGELAEGDDQVVEDVTEAVVRCYQCALPVKTKRKLFSFDTQGQTTLTTT